MIKVTIAQWDGPPPGAPDIVNGIETQGSGNSATILPARRNVVTVGGLDGNGEPYQVRLGARRIQTVFNRTGFELGVVPPFGQQIEAYARDAPTAVPLDGSATYVFDGVDKWIVE